MECDDDKLPLSEVGEWALEKHERLRRYVSVTRAVRKKWLTPMRPGLVSTGATYIDLFCGPGRSRIRDTDRVIDGCRECRRRGRRSVQQGIARRS
jgi:hypothetical protein